MRRLTSVVGWALLVLAIGVGRPGVAAEAPDASARVAQSKLGIYLIGSYTEGARRVMAAGPRVIKVLDPQANGAMREAMRDAKARHPEGLVVMRVWERTAGLGFRLQDDLGVSAEEFWQRLLEPATRALSPEDRKLVDFLEGTLFQIGDPRGWESFDLEPVAGWLAAHLKRE